MKIVYSPPSMHDITVMSMTKESAALNEPEAMSIAAVERDTGLSKDTLRVWERRYGFPVPRRDAQGDRIYDSAQVDKLRLVRRLLDQGHRPGKVVRASLKELTALLGRSDLGSASPVAGNARIAALMPLVKTQRAEELRSALRQLAVQLGLERFVLDVVAPMNVAVGEGWIRGDVSVPEEHLYSEQLQNVLRGAIHGQPFNRRRPRVLLTTFPEEEHGLGLLMVEAVLASEGAECLSLGIATPLADIRDAAAASNVDLVALSFSSAFPARQATAGLLTLRRMLPDSVTLWAGGAGVKGKAKPAPGILIIPDIADVATALGQWRGEHRAGLS